MIDEETFEREYRSHFRKTVCHLSKNFCRQPEDVAQAAWMLAWRAREQFASQGAAKFSTWVNVIAMNVYRDAIRKTKREVETVSTEKVYDGILMYSADWIDLHSLDLRLTVERLRPKHREAVEAFLAGFTQEEQSRRSGMSLQTTKIRLVGAREKLQELMAA